MVIKQGFPALLQNILFNTWAEYKNEAWPFLGQSPRTMQTLRHEIASGEKIPHTRHWLKVAELVGVVSNG
jgi:hypothetical protein